MRLLAHRTDEPRQQPRAVVCDDHGGDDVTEVRLRSVTRVLSGGLGDGAPHGYPARQERVDYVNGNPPALTQD